MSEQALRRLNFRHLRYFMVVASTGSVTAAAARLHVAPQTVSAQVLALEQAFGRPLFARVGKRLALNVDGEAALEYAQAIFSLGEELGDLLSGRGEPRRQRLRVGLTDSIPKMMALKLLEPAVFRKSPALELRCVEGGLNELVGRALDHQLDAVLADQPLPPELSRSLRDYELARPGLSFVATPELVDRHRGRFPQRLDGMPFLSWSSDSSINLSLQQWFARHEVRPEIVGRFDDSALMKAFAGRGLGAIAVPTLVERDACRQYGLKPLGRTEELHHPVYLLVPTRLRLHPLVELLIAGKSGAPSSGSRRKT